MMFSKQNLAKATFNISEKTLLDNYSNNNNVNVDVDNNNNASKICQEVSKNCF